MAHLEKIGGILQSFLSDRGYSSICNEFDVINNWKEIVGSDVASISTCIKVENSILYVVVSNASWRHEMFFLKAEILKKIKNIYACNSINDILFL